MQAMRFSLLQPVGVILVNALLAGFLSAIGVGNSYAENFLISQCIGLSIYAGCAAALRWASTPQRRLAGVIAAVPLGAGAGVAVSTAILGRAGSAWVSAMAWQSLLIGLLFGTAISALFYLRERMSQLESELKERQLREAQAEQERIGAQLRMLQAQIEPHFLFNTLASVQFLTETDPPAAHRLLGHLIAYLRAALPQLRAASTTLGKELELCEPYLAILRTRIGARLSFAIDVPDELRSRPFPPNLLISLVENAVKHGIEPSADGGTITIGAHREGDRLVVDVVDTGRGIVDAPAQRGGGVGLANVRKRLAALYGPRGRFTLSPVEPRGTRATLEIPIDTPS